MRPFIWHENWGINFKVSESVAQKLHENWPKQGFFIFFWHFLHRFQICNRCLALTCITGKHFTKLKPDIGSFRVIWGLFRVISAYLSFFLRSVTIIWAHLSYHITIKHFILFETHFYHLNHTWVTFALMSCIVVQGLPEI